jgi:hypothetical protein
MQLEYEPVHSITRFSSIFVPIKAFIIYAPVEPVARQRNFLHIITETSHELLLQVGGRSEMRLKSKTRARRGSRVAP